MNLLHNSHHLDFVKKRYQSGKSFADSSPIDFDRANSGWSRSVYIRKEYGLKKRVPCVLVYRVVHWYGRYTCF